MQYRTQIQDWLKAHEDEMLRALGELIAIPSVSWKKRKPAAFRRIMRTITPAAFLSERMHSLPCSHTSTLFRLEKAGYMNRFP